MAKTTSSLDVMSDRYRFDMNLCSASKGWAQVDTKQDASYYGTWANPLQLEIVNYCEGDIYHTECIDEADFIASLTTTIDWNRERGYWLGIYPVCDRIRSAFIMLGFRDELH